MKTITKSKFVCINCSYVNRGLLTVGKVYEVITKTDIDLGVDFGHTSFIADDGKSYLIVNSIDTQNFITLEEWRELQLNKLV